MKKSLHDHLDVIKNATIDLINQYESSEAALMIDDVLVTLAVPCTQLDFAKVPAPNKKKLFDEIQKYMIKSKKHLDMYTKEGIVDILMKDWLPTLAYSKKVEFLSEYKIVSGFDESTGAFQINVPLMETYIKLRDKGYTEIEYAAIQKTSGKSVRGKVATIGEGPFRTFVSRNVNGYWDVDTAMNSDHWRHIITLMTPKMKMLLAFYLEMPDYRGSCWQVGQKFGVKDASINLINTHIGMLAKKVMGNFNVQDPNNPNQNRYWSIPMNHGRHENEGFVWSMRPELVEAALEAKQKGLLPDVGHGLVDDDSIADDIPEWIVNRGEDQKNLVLPWIKAYKDNWDWLHRECIVKKPSSDFRKDTREGYKWLCTEHFRQTFDIDAEDFADIIEKSLKHSENLLAGPMYFAKDTLLKNAKFQPEGVRDAFKILYYGRASLDSRVGAFLDTMKDIHAENMINHKEAFNSDNAQYQQGPRTVSVYLSMMFPSKHYLFKQSVYEIAIQKMGLDQPALGSDVTFKLPRYEAFCDWLCSILLEDDELVELVSGTYPDDPSEFHITTQDFLYFVAEYYDSPIAVSAL